MNAMRLPSGENAGAVLMSSTSLRDGPPSTGIRNNDGKGAFDVLNTVQHGLAVGREGQRHRTTCRLAG